MKRGVGPLKKSHSLHFIYYGYLLAMYLGICVGTNKLTFVKNIFVCQALSFWLSN